uniref:Putative glutamate receptor n=1 Tax=Glossina morsitans morsitans TaxID=37546 RepID=D3TN54_GLOMM
MSTVTRPKLNKIPGGSMPVAKKDHYVEDLNNMTNLQLREIKEREERLLANKKQLQKLPDKGRRIVTFYDKLIKELDRRANVDQAAKLFSQLNIVKKGEHVINSLEWGSDDYDHLDDVLDSDDEHEMDPLRILAQKQMHEPRLQVIKPEVKLITEQDLKEIGSCESGCNLVCNSLDDTKVINADIVAIDVADRLGDLKPKLEALNSFQKGSCISKQNFEIEPHVNYLLEKTEHKDHCVKKDKFKPYQTTLSNVHDPRKEKMRKKGKHWEITAATPPPIQTNGTQMLSLLDSIELQTRHLQKLKELQEKQATDRLKTQSSRLSEGKIMLPNDEDLRSRPCFTIYRQTDRGQNETD